MLWLEGIKKFPDEVAFFRAIGLCDGPINQLGFGKAVRVFILIFGNQHDLAGDDPRYRAVLDFPDRDDSP
jgi:hypothetical protein